MDTITYFDRYTKYKSKYLELKKINQSGGSFADQSKIWSEYKNWYVGKLSNVNEINEMFRLVSEEQKEEIKEDIHNILNSHDSIDSNTPGPAFKIYEKLLSFPNDKLPNGNNFRESFGNSLIKLIANLKRKSSYESFEDDFENILKKKINLTDEEQNVDYTDLAFVIALKLLIELFNKITLNTEVPTKVNPETNRTEVLDQVTESKKVNGEDVEVAKATNIPTEIKEIYNLNLKETNLSLKELVILYAKAVNKLNEQQNLDTKCGEVYIKKGFDNCNPEEISEKKNRVADFESEKEELLNGETKFNEILDEDKMTIEDLNKQISENKENIKATTETINNLESKKSSLLNKIYKNISQPTPEENLEELELLEKDYIENGESKREENFMKRFREKFGLSGDTIEELLESLSKKHSRKNDQNPKETNFQVSK